MAGGSRILFGIMIGLLLTGCTSGPASSIGVRTPGGLMADLGAEQPTTTRAQLPDPMPPQPFKPAGAVKEPWALPAVRTDLLPSGNPALPGAGPIGVQQATALIESSDVRVKVRAWVNGQPIFDDELLHTVGPAINEYRKMPEPQRSEKIAEVFNKALDHLIDQEVMYQDAIKRLEKGNPPALKKLKAMAEQDYDKRIQKMRDAGAPEEYIKAISHVASRMVERDMISMQYAHQRVRGHIDTIVTLEEVKDYYEKHQNEFRTEDKVQWQDAFIAVSPKYPTPGDVRQYAEGLIAKCKTVEEFAKVLDLDDGDGKFRGHEGLGQRLYSIDKDGKRVPGGEIRPPELAPYLAQLQEGQIGPVVELGTGVHVVRVLKREFAGQQPLNDQVQKQIRRKLENEIAEREVRQLVRDLRARSVIRIVREGQ
jgi:peptidyl-prolyl cis-trans isomerase SurA